MGSRSIDLRTVPIWERHPMIFAALDELAPGQGLVLVNDHEPLPLRLEIERTRPSAFSWSAIMTAGDAWEIAIERLEPNAPSGDVRAALARAPVFRDVAPDVLDRLAAAAHIVRIKPGAALFEQGEPFAYLGVVANGALTVSVASHDGRTRSLFDADTSDVLNAFTVFDGGVTVGRAAARSRGAAVVLVALEAVREAAAADVSLSRALGVTCAQRARRSIEHLAQASESVVTRLAVTILRYAPPERGLVPALAPLRDMTLADLASASGSVREVVSRSLNQIESAGAIERSKGRIVRVDRERLQALA
ncbi:MAG TPA: DUF2249 domain-containing protein [Candidatus Elarobacter sp.]|nr:DUF2249 domain-containing protein [Candidatus Elarobacter sp.]